MKKLKFLLMLLLTVFLFETSSLKVEAAITDITEIPEYSVSEDESFYNGDNHLTTLQVSKEDEGKKQKIVIPEYSYCEIDSLAGDVALYSNNMKKIIKSDSINMFLPKGEYFLCIENYKEFDGYDPVLYYGRASVDDIMTQTIKKSSKYYDVNYSFCCPPRVEAFMVSDFEHFYYGQDYTITLDLENELNVKYRKLTFNLCVKGKDSNAKVTPTGTTKKVLNAEKTDEGSDKKDKKKPTVKGVKNGKTYKKTVKIKVSDASGIKKVTLNGKKMKVSKFKKGYKIKKKGKYTLKVWDKANNKRTVKFRIKK